MTGDRHNFLSLTESKSGNLTFGNNAPKRIKGKGLVTLDNGRGKAKDVLFIDGLKHNLLSVIQMCDRGCKVTFTTRDCKIESTSVTPQIPTLKCRKLSVVTKCRILTMVTT